MFLQELLKYDCWSTYIRSSKIVNILVVTIITRDILHYQHVDFQQNALFWDQFSSLWRPHLILPRCLRTNDERTTQDKVLFTRTLCQVIFPKFPATYCNCVIFPWYKGLIKFQLIFYRISEYYPLFLQYLLKFDRWSTYILSSEIVNILVVTIITGNIIHYPQVDFQQTALFWDQFSSLWSPHLIFFATLLTNERRQNDSGQRAFQANIMSSDLPKIARYLLQLRHMSVIKGFDQI